MAMYEGLPRMAGNAKTRTGKAKNRQYTPPSQASPKGTQSMNVSPLRAPAPTMAMKKTPLRTYTPPQVGRSPMEAVAGVGNGPAKPVAKAGASFKRTPSKGMMGDFMDEKKQSPEYAMMQKAARRKYTPPSQADASAKPRKPADLLEEIDKYAKNR